MQTVKEGSLVVRGRLDATSESLDTAGPELEYSKYVDGDVTFIRVNLASGDWATHSLDVQYEITNAVCRSKHALLPSGALRIFPRFPELCTSPHDFLSSDSRHFGSTYSSSAQDQGTVLHQFHAPWSNWWKIPVRSPIR